MTDERAARLDDPSTDPFEVAEAAAAVVRERTGADRHDVALVLGSGWADAGGWLGDVEATLDQGDLPGFAAPSVPGQSRLVRSLAVGDTGKRALVFGGRTHLYEGRGVRAVVHVVRTAAAAGCRRVVLTNGCGGLSAQWPPGTVVLVSDHLNLTGRSPVEGATFLDLTDLYSARLRALAHTVDPSLPEGVYVQLPGPHYETPAEVRMARLLGGDLVGMSTALEAIAARQSGMQVLALSLVTNLAAGVSPRPVSHDEVLETGRTAADRCGQLLARMLPAVLSVG
ncbi:MAG: purine-nucleoside phosphorylase [Dermatophilaceae bacterium]